MMVRRKKRRLTFLVMIVLVVAGVSVYHNLPDKDYVYGLFGINAKDPDLVLTTGYCNCGTCCGWVRTKEGTGEAVYNYGPMTGKPKKVGITFSGTRAQHGTVAADLKVFSLGTKLEIPGYGVGIVEDIGGAIKGRHIDLWFPTHDAARRWGRRWLKVRRVQ